MKTVIVPLKYGSSLCETEDGWILFEVDRDLLIDTKRKHVGISELQNCRTLNDVRALFGMEVPHGDRTDCAS